MIKLLTAKNFKLFSDLHLDLAQTALLMGNNGCGKTSIFDILWGIRQLLVEGSSCADAFPIKTLSRWLAADAGNIQQAFSLAVDSPFGDLHYELTIDHNVREGQSRIAEELLRDEEGLLFSFERSNVQLYRDNHSEGPAFKLDWSRSALATVPPSFDNKKLTFFRECMKRVTCVRIDAPRMVSLTEHKSLYPDRDFANFAAWYGSAILSKADSIAEFLKELRGVLSGFRSLNLPPVGQGYSILQAKMNRSSEAKEVIAGAPLREARQEYTLDFDELSDGQRTLIALYAILHFLVEDGAVLCLDEPDSFLALEEVRPFIDRLLDEVEERGAQVLIASHHPKLFNTLARDYGIKLAPNGSGGMIAVKYKPPADSPLAVSQLIEQGDLS